MQNSTPSETNGSANIIESETIAAGANIRSLRPNFPIKGRKTARTRIMEIFHNEKNRLFDYFSSLNCRFSCTMDVWTSNQNKGYLCVTCHFIDDEWKIHKRIINFMHLEGRHT